MRKKRKNYGFIILPVKISIFGCFSVFIREFGGGGLEGDGKSCFAFGAPRVHRENLFLQHKNLCALMLFAFICTYTIQPRPLRANPAPTKGSVTFLNEEINLSWHPPSCFALMVISFRKGGETICDSIRRGFYALIWFTNLSFSLSASYFTFFCCCCWFPCRRNEKIFSGLTQTKEKLNFMRNFRVATYFMFIKKLPFYVFNKSRRRNENSFPFVVFIALFPLLVIFIFPAHKAKEKVDWKFFSNIAPFCVC